MCAAEDVYADGRRAEGEHSTHHIGALGLEGVGATHVQVGRVVWLQEADEVETLRLGRKMDPGKGYGPGTGDTRTRMGTQTSTETKGAQGRECVPWGPARGRHCGPARPLPMSTHLVALPFLDTLRLLLRGCLP